MDQILYLCKMYTIHTHVHISFLISSNVRKCKNLHIKTMNNFSIIKLSNMQWILKIYIYHILIFFLYTKHFYYFYGLNIHRTNLPERLLVLQNAKIFILDAFAVCHCEICISREICHYADVVKNNERRCAVAVRCTLLRCATPCRGTGLLGACVRFCHVYVTK